MADPKDSFDKIKQTFGMGKKPKDDLSGYVFDKVQPQARLMEEAVLGSMMMDKEAVSEIIDILEPNSFYVDAHQIIYKAMKDLFGDSKPIDLLTVSEQLRKMGKMEQIGGAFYLSKLTNTVATTANIEAHARIIAEKYIKRELIRTSNEIIKESFEETNDALDLLEKAQRDLFGIAQGNIRRNYDSMSNLLTQALKQIEEVSKNSEGVTGVPSGFVQLDAVTAGWQKSDFIVMAARPGMGKTSFVLALARNAAVEFKKPVAIFSLEMSSVQLVQRLISSEAEIASEKLRKGTLAGHEWGQLTSKITNLSDAPIYIDDTPGINIFELRAKCRRLKMNHDIQMVVIDYLQLMTGSADGGKGGNREQEISHISRSLKGIAKELDVPVIALSQLSRAVEQRGGLKKPQLSDLRECITGDTLIYLPEEGNYVPVKQLLEERGAGFKVLSLNEDTYKLEPALCLDVWETGEKEIFEIETQSGFKIKTSANHPFFTANGWQKLEDLAVGDFVATARSIENSTKSCLKDEELILLAHMIGDGCYVERQAIHYTSQEKASNISRNRLEKVATVLESEQLENLATSDLKWEKIKSITKLGKEMTYDLHIEGLHNFVANDFVIHNSGAIEQDADMVVFLYRPEYYGFDQDEDGNPTQGLAEIIIAKHRNGSLETVKTRFIGKYTKFVDLDSGYGGGGAGNNHGPEDDYNTGNSYDTFQSAANTNFNTPNIQDSNSGMITLGSKMNTPPPPPPPNNEEEDDDDIPF